MNKRKTKKGHRMKTIPVTGIADPDSLASTYLPVLEPIFASDT